MPYMSQITFKPTRSFVFCVVDVAEKLGLLQHLRLAKEMRCSIMLVDHSVLLVEGTDDAASEGSAGLGSFDDEKTVMLECDTIHASKLES